MFMHEQGELVIHDTKRKPDPDSEKNGKFS